MKILLIHSQDVEVVKNKEATSNPQEFKGDLINLKGLILVCFVSVEDQDTYDIDLISKQGAEEIEEAILQITGFPEKIRQKNEEIREYNNLIESGEIKGKPGLESNKISGIKRLEYLKRLESLNLSDNPLDGIDEFYLRRHFVKVFGDTQEKVDDFMTLSVYNKFILY